MKNKEINEIKEKLKKFDEQIRKHDEKIVLLEKTLEFAWKHTAYDVIMTNEMCYWTTNTAFMYIFGGFVKTSKTFGLPSWASYDRNDDVEHLLSYKVLNSNNETALVKITKGDNAVYIQLYKHNGDVADITDSVIAIKGER